MINISNSMLENFRHHINWMVGQNNRTLAKGLSNRSEVFDVVKKANIHIPTDQELAAEQQKKIEKYKKFKELKVKKKEEEKKSQKEKKS